MKIKELFSEEHVWQKYCEASNKDGFYVDACSSEAISYCLMGAIKKCYIHTERYFSVQRSVLEYIIANKGCWANVLDYNDDVSTTFADIQEIVTNLGI